ncbi:UPF0158 family protein [Mesorhizobium sp. 1B3]|uniref:UPF0158 family protein n=1 Tax=Mesorhizobium sp. 1B3 TaxID=3243599 RepID=UPI003D95DA95
MPVKMSDLINAFEIASAGAGYGDRAYVHRLTGEIFVISDTAGIYEGPEDMEESDEFLAIPTRSELQLGRDVVLSFVGQEAPDEWEDVSDMFRRKGAYGRFKQWLHDKGKLHAWHAFEEKATEEALREWCEDNEIAVADGD